MAHTKTKRPFSRGEKWLFFGCPVLVGIIASGALVYAAREATPVITFPPLPRPPKPNGYDLYLNAAKAIAATSPTPTVDPADDASPPLTAAGRAARYSLVRRRAWLQASAPGFALVDKALKTPCLFPFARDTGPVTFVPMARFRQLARDEVKRANTYKMEGRWGEATKAGLDAIQMGGDTGRGGYLIPKMVSTAAVAIGRNPLEDFDDLPGHLSAREARTATTRLENLLAALPTYTNAIEQERWVTLKSLLTLMSTRDWRTQPERDSFMGGATLPWRDRLTSRLIAKDEIIRRVNARYDEVLSEFRLPYSQRGKSKGEKLDVFSDTYTGFLGMAYRQQAREQVALRLLLLRFALQSYRAEHSAYPATLALLSPAYLKRVPTDDYADDQPFHYRNLGTKYRLWSVGPDGVNDGGTPVPSTHSLRPGERPRPAPVSFDSKGDWVAGLNR